MMVWSLSAWSRISFRYRVVQDKEPYSDIDTIIGEDEGGVGGSELSVRHLVALIPKKGDDEG